MKYWIENLGRKRLYTERLLEHLAYQHGHEFERSASSIVLVSLCDVTELSALERLRERTPNSRIIAGGHFAKIGARVIGLFADAVWIGHAFDFFSCQTWDQIMVHPACYVPGVQESAVASQRIDWRYCPAIQTDKRRFYLWGGVGCKGKCSFCLTSWTERHQSRPGLQIVTARSKSAVGKRGTLKVISNAYSAELGDDLVQDMMLRDLLEVRENRKRKLIRCGVEFATEASRQRHAKPVRDEEIRAAIRRAEALNLDLQLFLIGGRDARDDWAQLIEAIPASDALKPKVYLKWTNLEYQQKTPLWNEVKSLDPDRYLDKSFTDWAFRVAAHKCKRVRVLPVKYPAHAIWRTCLSNARTMDEYMACKQHNTTKDLDQIVKLFQRLRPWETDLSEIVVSPFDKVKEKQ